MKITIEIDSKNEMDRLSAFFETFKIDNISIVSPGESSSTIVKGNKKIDPTSLFKIWEKHPRTLEDIRKTSWLRNTDGK